MSSQYETIQTILDTQLLTVIKAEDLQTENTIRTSKTTNFVRSTLLPAQTQILTLGVGGIDRLNGLFQIDVFTKIGTGFTEGNNTADAIMNAFVKGANHTSNNVIVTIDNKWRISSRTLQNFYVVPVFIQWSCYLK
jgi:hypothetical protein